MRWGDIVLVELDPARGNEANKTRPAIIVSSNGANGAVTALGRGMITILPITGNTGTLYPFQVLIEEPEDLQSTGLTKPSKIQAEQIRSIDSFRVLETLGYLREAQKLPVQKAVRLHLAL